MNNQKTTVLVRAASALKDNRIPPKGFSQTHEVYDTTRISGLALQDTDFNQGLQGEGSGSDVVYFHIPTQGYFDALSITATVYYQSMPPEWMVEMFSESTPEIDRFVEMYNGAQRSPSIVGQDAITVGGIVSSKEVAPELAAKIFVTAERALRVETPVAVEMKIYHYLGQQLQRTYLSAGSQDVPLSFGRQLAIVHLYSPEGQLTRTIWVP